MTAAGSGGEGGARASGPAGSIARRLAGASSRWLAASALLAVAAFVPVALTDLLVIALSPVEDAAPLPGGVLLAVLLILCAAGVLGWLQAPLLALGDRVIRALGPARAFRSAVVGVVAVPLVGALWAFLGPGLDRISEAELRVTVQVAFVVGASLAAVVAGVLAASVAEPRLARAGRLEAATRLAAGLAVAGGIVWIVVLWRRFAQGFTDAVPLAGLALAGLAQAAFLLILASAAPLRRVVHRVLSVTAVRVLLPLLPVLAFAAAEGTSLVDTTAAPWVVAHNGVGGRVLAALRHAWDFDGDGSSPLLGGGDCDDSDPSINPTAMDEPGDGIDQDCDGRDAQPGKAAVLSAYTRDPAQGHRYNVVFICIDAFRADHASFLGYARHTTPHLETLARDAWVFENVISASSTTRESIPPLFTGRFNSGIAWEPEAKVRQVAPTQRLLAEVLKARGWQTFGVVDEWLKKFLPTVLRGFDVADVPYGLGKWKEYGQQSAPYTLFHAVELLSARDKSKPFLLYTHFEAPHYPYVRHEDVPSFGSQPADLYDGEIAYADRYVGLLLEYLEDQKLMDDTVFVIFGDHGEEFGEHGGRQHSRTLHAECVHVPLIIKVPGQRPARVKYRVSLVDVFPTLMDILGLRPDEPQPEGVSLFHYLHGPNPWPDRDLYSELMVNNEGPMKYRKAIYEGQYKLLWDMSSGATELYDVVKDPGEHTPLTDPPVQDALFEKLKDFVAAGDHHP